MHMLFLMQELTVLNTQGRTIYDIRFLLFFSVPHWISNIVWFSSIVAPAQNPVHLLSPGSWNQFICWLSIFKLPATYSLTPLQKKKVIEAELSLAIERRKACTLLLVLYWDVSLIRPLPQDSTIPTPCPHCTWLSLLYKCVLFLCS